MNGRQNEPTNSDLPPGLSQPAQRALAGAGIQNLEQLSRFSEDEIKKLHGIGPRAMDLLKKAMEVKGLTFSEK